MSNSPVFADFWLDQEQFSDYIDPNPENKDEAFSIDLIQLASVRRIVSNYVDILSGMSIPVFFKAEGSSSNVGGKEIYITTAIHRRKDFDQAVGLALHEAAHTVLSDFDIVKTIPFNTPKIIWDFGKRKNVRKQTLERFIKSMVNMVEDWYIDDWVIKSSPGYVGYYQASYDVCFNSPIIDQLLISNEYRYPSLMSYEFRIINFCNPLTDLTALPGLDEIAKTIDISNISRLNTQMHRIKVAFDVVKLVLQNIEKYHDKFNPQCGQGQPQVGKKIMSVSDFFKGKGEKGEEGQGKDKSEADRTVQDVADALANRPKQPDDENKAIASQVTKSPEKELDKDIQKAVQAQVHYVHGEVKKEELNTAQKTMLDLIEKHGISLVYVPVVMAGNEAAFNVGCIVVNKLTMDLIAAGTETFPLANFWRDENRDIQPDQATSESVRKGIELGTKLGKRLLIRREIRRDKQIRKKAGTINRRLLYSADFADDIFEKIKIVHFNKGSLHITVDASTSMQGNKWQETIKTTVAICKATSMVDNIHVTVSFRATKDAKGINMPYIVMAYDSAKDKFSKVKNLFRYLKPNGFTPEGLSFAAIMGLFTNAAPDEEDRYFLNLSDGEPCFTMRSPLTGAVFTYSDGNGVEHTKNQVAKIRRQGIRILSYYIQDADIDRAYQGSGHDTKKNFRTMYGKDAKFIKTNDVVALANTINQLFLKGI